MYKLDADQINRWPLLMKIIEECSPPFVVSLAHVQTHDIFGLPRYLNSVLIPHYLFSHWLTRQLLSCTELRSSVSNRLSCFQLSREYLRLLFLLFSPYHLWGLEGTESHKPFAKVAQQLVTRRNGIALVELLCDCVHYLFA